MNQEKFIKAISNRANQEVQARIGAFYKQITSALYTLSDGGISSFGDNRGQELLQCLLQKLNYNENRKWPAWLWREEEERVQKKLFAMMDPIQQALSAPDPKPEDEQPAEEAQKNV